MTTQQKPQAGWEQELEQHRQQYRQTNNRDGRKAWQNQSANHQHHKTDTKSSRKEQGAGRRQHYQAAGSSSSSQHQPIMCPVGNYLHKNIYAERSKQNSLAINYENTLNR